MTRRGAFSCAGSLSFLRCFAEPDDTLADKSFDLCADHGLGDLRPRLAVYSDRR